MRLGVIPARGGSKRIPHKNIKMFHGQPMIAWSIRAAIDSGCFDRLIVSTDDEAIAAVAQKAGAEVPFRRPPELSDDHTGTIPVIAHAVEWQAANGLAATEVCCLYATAPFIQPADIQKGLTILRDCDTDYALSVVNYAFPIQRALRLMAGQRIEMFQPQHFQTRSQDLEEAWHDAGQFYWGKASAWLAQKTLFTPDSAAVIIPCHRAQDIDTPEDWLQAELMFKARRYDTASE